jgi:hypothetical protein
MPPFEPFLLVFVAGLLLDLFARTVLLRYLVASAAIFLVSLLTAQMLGSPHVFFYASAMLAIAVDIQRADVHRRADPERWLVPFVAGVWGVAWFGFPGVYADISKWLSLGTFVAFFYSVVWSRPNPRPSRE